MQKFDLGQLFRFYMRRFWIIILVALVGAAAGWVYSGFIVKPEYKSTSTVILDQSKQKTDATLINNYMALLKSRKVLEPIMQKNSLSIDYSTLMQDITIVNEKSTEIITISVVANDPGVAQTINLDLIDNFNLKSLGLAENREDEKDAADGMIIKVIDLASYDESPINIKTEQNVLLAAGGSVAMAIGLLTFIYDYRQSQHHKRARSVARRRSAVVGSITMTQSNNDMAEPMNNNKIALIDREARDILDVLENLDGVTPESRYQ